MKRAIAGIGGAFILGVGLLLSRQTPPEYSSHCAIPACAQTPDVNLIPFDGHFNMNPATHKIEVGAGNTLKLHVVKTTPFVTYISISGIGVFGVTVIFNTGTGEEIPVTYTMNGHTDELIMYDPHSAMQDQPQSFAQDGTAVIAIPYNSRVPAQVVVDNSEVGALEAVLGNDEVKSLVTVETVNPFGTGR